MPSKSVPQPMNLAFLPFSAFVNPLLSYCALNSILQLSRFGMEV